MPKKHITVDELAAMTQRGLRDVEQRIGERMDTGFQALAEQMASLTTQVSQGFQHVTARIDMLRQDISDLPAIREELKELRERVQKLERAASH